MANESRDFRTIYSAEVTAYFQKNFNQDIIGEVVNNSTFNKGQSLFCNFMQFGDKYKERKLDTTNRIWLVIYFLSGKREGNIPSSVDDFLMEFFAELNKKYGKALRLMFLRSFNSKHDGDHQFAWHYLQFIFARDNNLAKDIFKFTCDTLTEDRLFNILSLFTDPENVFAKEAVLLLEEEPYKSQVETIFKKAFQRGNSKTISLAWQCLNNLGAFDFDFAFNVFKLVENPKNNDAPIREKVIRNIPETITYNFWNAEEASKKQTFFDQLVHKDENFSYALLSVQSTGFIKSQVLPENISAKLAKKQLIFNQTGMDLFLKNAEKKSSFRTFVEDLKPANDIKFSVISPKSWSMSALAYSILSKFLLRKNENLFVKPLAEPQQPPVVNAGQPEIAEAEENLREGALANSVLANAPAALVEEQDVHRKAEEQEKVRLAEEQEKARIAEEQEKLRIAEQEKARIAEEQEKLRIAEKEKARKAEEQKKIRDDLRRKNEIAFSKTEERINQFEINNWLKAQVPGYDDEFKFVSETDPLVANASATPSDKSKDQVQHHDFGSELLEEEQEEFSNDNEPESLQEIKEQSVEVVSDKPQKKQSGSSVPNYIESELPDRSFQRLSEESLQQLTLKFQKVKAIINEDSDGIDDFTPITPTNSSYQGGQSSFGSVTLALSNSPRPTLNLASVPKSTLLDTAPSTPRSYDSAKLYPEPQTPTLCDPENEMNFEPLTPIAHDPAKASSVPSTPTHFDPADASSEPPTPTQFDPAKASSVPSTPTKFDPANVSSEPATPTQFDPAKASSVPPTPTKFDPANVSSEPATPTSYDPEQTTVNGSNANRTTNAYIFLGYSDGQPSVIAGMSQYGLHGAQLQQTHSNEPESKGYDELKASSPGAVVVFN